MKKRGENERQTLGQVYHEAPGQEKLQKVAHVRQSIKRLQVHHSAQIRSSRSDKAVTAMNKTVTAINKTITATKKTVSAEMCKVGHFRLSIKRLQVNTPKS